MSKSFFIDTTVCTACRGCQVACKQWHDLPAEQTENRGTYQNPKDLSFNTYKLVRMEETAIDGQLRWLFFPDQCRHCFDAPCQYEADNPRAIFTDDATGAVLYTAHTRVLDADAVIQSCPYDIPRKGPDGVLAKCDMCIDRVRNGLEPACVKVCPTNAMNFGEREAMQELAEQRLAAVKTKYPRAQLLDPQDVRAIFLTAFEPDYYHAFAVAARSHPGITRHAALRRMLWPLRRATAHWL